MTLIFGFAEERGLNYRLRFVGRNVDGEIAPKPGRSEDAGLRIGVIGTGYVGLVVGACLAENGNAVIPTLYVPLRGLCCLQSEIPTAPTIPSPRSATLSFPFPFHFSSTSCGSCSLAFLLLYSPFPLLFVSISLSHPFKRKKFLSAVTTDRSGGLNCRGWL